MMAKWDVTEEPFEIIDARFLNEMGVLAKVPTPPPPQVEPVRQETNSDWYKQGKECPF